MANDAWPYGVPTTIASKQNSSDAGNTAASSPMRTRTTLTSEPCDTDTCWRTMSKMPAATLSSCIRRPDASQPESERQGLLGHSFNQSRQRSRDVRGQSAGQVDRLRNDAEEHDAT